jgi:hypothetical protein
MLHYRRVLRELPAKGGRSGRVPCQQGMLRITRRVIAATSATRPRAPRFPLPAAQTYTSVKSLLHIFYLPKKFLHRIYGQQQVTLYTYISANALGIRAVQSPQCIV